MFRASAVRSIRLPDLDLQPPPGHCLEPYGWVTAECDHGSRIHVPMTCGRCAPCLARRAWTHACRVEYAIGTASPAAKIELTSRPGTTWPEIMRAWQSMARALRRRAPSMEYAAVKETGARAGMKHLHVVCVGWSFITQTNISDLWNRYLGAYVVWLRRVDGKEAARYVSKYLAKARLPGIRSITYSRGFPVQDFPHNFHSCGKRATIPDDMLLLGTAGSGILVERHAPGCHCLPQLEPISDGERAWLALLSAPSRPMSRDVSVASSSDTRGTEPSLSLLDLLRPTPRQRQS